MLSGEAIIVDDDRGATPRELPHPSLSRSGETLTIEAIDQLEGETGERQDVGDKHEWSWSCGWSGGCAAPAAVPDPELVEELGHSRGRRPADRRDDEIARYGVARSAPRPVIKGTAIRDLATR
jgi:hypothetical protein